MTSNTIGSGGNAVHPAPTWPLDGRYVTVEDAGTTDDGLSQKFTYHGVTVGTAVVDKDGDKADSAVSDYQPQDTPLSPLPFVLIFGAGILILGLLVYLMRKVLKS